MGIPGLGWDQVEALCSNPNLAATISIAPVPQCSGKALRVIGYLPSGASLTGKPGRRSTWVRQALDAINDSDPYDRYGIMFPTPRRYYNSYLKYDVVRSTLSDHNSTALRFSIYCLRRIYAPIVQNWVPVDFDHCHIPLESSPGWPYTYWCGSKVQFYEKFGDLVDLYHEKVRMGIRPFIVWSVFIKTELLKRRKLDTDDGRTIICPPAEFLTVGKMYTQDFNERIISAWKGIPVKLGFVKYFGEFHEFAKKMDRFPNKLEGDATKWDSTLDTVDSKILKDFRKDTISPAYKTKEVFNCLDVIYMENSHTRDRKSVV